ncbi:hypothetical protein [Rhizobium sp. HT1-10]|uniref:hypothetical protein n=1 Tax=Rhizobium sp. HT1-10 TaxID=3111638 RepID=UPI003C193CC8
MNRRTVLKGGIVLAVTSHTAVATAEAKRSRKEEIREYLVRLRALILEETGEDWIVLAAGSGVITLDEKGFHDPRGRFGPAMEYGQVTGGLKA